MHLYHDVRRGNGGGDQNTHLYYISTSRNHTHVYYTYTSFGGGVEHTDTQTHGMHIHIIIYVHICTYIHVYG